MANVDLTRVDFDSLRASMREYLKSQDQFKDYNFDGANMSVLLDLLAYNTYNNAFYLGMVGSEMFIDTAQLRDSVVSHAKELNYTPRSKTSAIAYVDIAVAGIGNPDKITIQEGFALTGIANNRETYTFTTDSPIIVDSSTNYTAFNVPIYEGVLVEEVFLVNEKPRFLLASSDVDISSIKVEVQNSSTDFTKERWERAYTLFGVANEARVFFVQGAESGKYELTFGNDIVGKKLKFGNLVRVRYRRTSGPAANNIAQFRTSSSVGDDIGLVESVSVATRTVSYGGSESETVDSIRQAAPKYFTTQERAVTSEDYQILVRNNFPFVQSVIAYGGEQLSEPRYGKVFVAVKPNFGLVTSDNQKLQILRFVKQRAPVSIDPVIVDPNYVFVKLDTVVKYNPTRTNLNDLDVKFLVETAVRRYRDGQINDFGRDIRHSRLLAAIDAANEGIISNETTLTLYNELTDLPLLTPFSRRIEFSNEIEKDASKLPLDYPTNVFSSQFTYTFQNRNVPAILVDDGVGSLQVKGLDGTVYRENVGVVNYEQGFVQINSLQVSGLVDNKIKVFAVPRFKDVEVNTNKILTILDSDITVTVDGIIE